MEMHGGIYDARCFADLLIDVANGADPSRLDTYQACRRPIARHGIVAQADKNRASMSTTDEAERVLQLRRLQEISSDPLEARQLLFRSSMIDGLQRS